ncbi:uncharacterized protein BYT42DRAFT_577859 [Radiomyces spectabilis]|uniref:uncharacterized protein n=1 Tax=Radiomyces spectabilis TaxID=64574 RepID=UPI00221F11D7|nr:uncharacterized protein BYT42DRAFT_577859 [Radiomyces spectabilis]KAI8372744.1 hypothetical protein BYT42DRAFT_577859 [Radiomyces spectabilis]
MLSRIFTSIRDQLTRNAQRNGSGKSTLDNSKLPIEDSDEFMKATTHAIAIAKAQSHHPATLFGLSTDFADDYMQKDIISYSWN